MDDGFDIRFDQTIRQIIVFHLCEITLQQVCRHIDDATSRLKCWKRPMQLRVDDRKLRDE